MIKNILLTFILSIIICGLVYAVSSILRYEIVFIGTLFSLGGIASLLSIEITRK